MSNLRFNHVFAALLLLSFFSAFVIPPRFTNPARAELQGLFAPISRPVRSVSGMVYSHFHPEVAVDLGSPIAPRAEQSIVQENQQLRQDLARLTKKFENLSQLNDDRQEVRDINPLCKPASVTGADSSGIRESLTISAPSMGGLDAGRAVIFAEGIVGKVTRAGLTSGQVRLITDPGFVVIGQIRHLKADQDGKFTSVGLKELQPLLQGVGHGAMVIRNSISMKQVSDMGIAVNDTIHLADSEWPANLQGSIIGQITRIQANQHAPLFADIQVEPLGNLMQLREVMVMAKE
jgi:hypothetical protein